MGTVPAVQRRWSAVLLGSAEIGVDATGAKVFSEGTGAAMTIAISVKVNDGLVLATDSASTMMRQGPANTNLVYHVYENANKVFNLCKGRALGAMTWGIGEIGGVSTETLVKDFRQKITPDLCDKQRLCVREMAERFKSYIFEEHYEKAFEKWPQKPSLGFLVAGYSTDEPRSEQYVIDIGHAGCQGPIPMLDKVPSGIFASGEPEVVFRVILGHSPTLPSRLMGAGLESEKFGPVLQRLNSELVTPAMPIQDAIDLAIFLVRTAIDFAKFTPGAPTVGGPIEVATITKHENFRWIRRKHYFSKDVNPQEGRQS